MAKQGGDIDGDATLDARVDALVELGLEKYGEGDLVGALSDWEHAVSLKPEASRATAYIEYVRSNFAALEEQFRKARETADAAAADGVPFVDEHTFGGGPLPDDEDAYEAFELDEGEEEFELQDSSEARLNRWIEEASIDEGWVLDELAPAAPLPPAPKQPEQRLGPGLDEVAEQMVGVEGGEIGDGAAEVAADAATRESAGDEADFGELNAVLGADEPPAPAPGHDDDLEETVPGGQQPPPLPERPSLSDEAIAAMEVDRALQGDLGPTKVPGTDVPADFDLGEVGRLDDGLRDDRIVEPDDVKDVRVTFHDVGTSERTVPARPSQTGASFEMPAELELEVPGDLAGRPPTDTEDAMEETVERHGAGSQWPAAFDDLAEDEQTRERGSIAVGAAHVDDGASRPPTVDPSLEAGGVVLEDRESEELEETGVGPSQGGAVITGVTERPAGLDAARMQVVAAQLDREVEAAAPADESDTDRTRRRVTALIDRAGREYEAGHYPRAVAALDLALDEKPESAIAQKIVHRHRDLLFGIYEAYIGDDKAMPVVALPTHEIALQELDSRAAFLLSRIDGSLSFEEILDVAGMSRLEAYRHLCRLLLRGILEVR